jgi:aminoglycoside phosphotransferase (APT) family kinase protein
VDGAVIDWAAAVIGDPLTVIRGLREGASPWLVAAGDRSAVLRVGHSGQDLWFATEAAAIGLAASAGIPVPAVLSTDDGASCGVPLMLMEYLPGTSHIPRERDDRHLRILGAAAARIHAIDLEPSDCLPARDRPIAEVDFARIRREQGASPLLLEAERIVANDQPAGERTGFVHGDLWHGNTLWDGGTLTALIDWDMAGAGAAGVDLGSLRCDAALAYGPEAAGEILAGWEESAGRAAANVAYWDAVAALSTPPDMGWFVAAFADQGRPDLDQQLMLDRRDAFLRQALALLS